MSENEGRSTTPKIESYSSSVVGTSYFVQILEPALEEIEAFILNLPRGYRPLAYFVLATAADPELAISLEVERVHGLWSEFGYLGAMQKLARVPVNRCYEALLPIHIRGRRASFLRRQNNLHGEGPPQVYLDRHARALTLAKANAAFTRVSKRMNLQTPITLETIACTVVASFMNEVAAKQWEGDQALEKHLWEVYGAGPEDVIPTYPELGAILMKSLA